MDWLRRNWPDLIIGVALVAVVALIVVTLLSGGSLASLVRRDSPPELALTETTPGGTTPSGTTPSGATRTPTNNSDSSNNTADSSGSNPGASTSGNSTSDSVTGSGSEGGVDVFVPGVPGGRADAVPDSSVGQAQADGAANPAERAGATESGTDQNAAPAGGGPLPEAVTDGGFRVAAGAVDSRDAAASLAESYREADYTVTVEQQNDLYLLWIGPYATRTGAERVANRLITDDVVSDALVYTYSGPSNGAPEVGSSAISTSNSASEADTPSGNETANAGSTTLGAGSSPANAAAPSPTPANNDANTGTSADTNADTNANATPATTPPTNPATATAQRYLQVGAFGSDRNAQPLREQLEGLGFNVTSSESDSGLIRLLVGPFGAAQLPQTQQRLTAMGVTDSFPVVP